MNRRTFFGIGIGLSMIIGIILFSLTDPSEPNNGYPPMVLVALVAGFGLAALIYGTIKTKGWLLAALVIIGLIASNIDLGLKVDNAERHIKIKANTKTEEVQTTNTPESPQSKQYQAPVKKQEKCSRCFGSTKCKTCGRTGKVRCWDHDSNGDGNCTFCHNSGNAKCYTCGGKGYCIRCNGTGYK